jgi:hypothetical protein
MKMMGNWMLDTQWERRRGEKKEGRRGKKKGYWEEEP